MLTSGNRVRRQLFGSTGLDLFKVGRNRWHEMWVAMAGRGPAPKDARLRQRTNRKAGAGPLVDSSAAPAPRAKVPNIPNPDLREWHALTLIEWKRWWKSPMALKWLDSDFGGLAILARLYDDYFKSGDVELLKEIRLQRPCFGLTPLDRSRLQWEIVRGDEADSKGGRDPGPPARVAGDPRLLRMVPKK